MKSAAEIIEGLLEHAEDTQWVDTTDRLGSESYLHIDLGLGSLGPFNHVLGPPTQPGVFVERKHSVDVDPLEVRVLFVEHPLIAQDAGRGAVEVPVCRIGPGLKPE